MERDSALNVGLSPNVMALTILQATLQAFLHQKTRRSSTTLQQKLDEKMRRSECRDELDFPGVADISNGSEPIELDLCNSHLNECAEESTINGLWDDHDNLTESTFTEPNSVPTKSLSDVLQSGFNQSEPLGMIEAGIFLPLQTVALEIGRALNYQFLAMKFGPSKQHHMDGEDVLNFERDYFMYEWTAVSYSGET